MLKFNPRNDLVIVRIVYVNSVKGIAMPQSSIDGKEFHVVAFGPKVEGLKEGDKVMMTGNLNEHYHQIPGQSNLIIVKQECVLLTIEGEEEA